MWTKVNNGYKQEKFNATRSLEDLEAKKQKSPFWLRKSNWLRKQKNNIMNDGRKKGKWVRWTQKEVKRVGLPVKEKAINGEQDRVQQSYR